MQLNISFFFKLILKTQFMTWIDFWLLIIRREHAVFPCYDSQDTKQLIPFLKHKGEMWALIH